MQLLAITSCATVIALLSDHTESRMEIKNIPWEVYLQISFDPSAKVWQLEILSLEESNCQIPGNV